MLFKFLHIVLLASIKYFITLPYAMLIGMNYGQAIAAVLIGGIGGFLFFYYLSKYLDKVLVAFWAILCRSIPLAIKTRYHNLCNTRGIKRNSARSIKRKRKLVRIKATYGFWGIIFATPSLLSIPVGAFLVSKYYPHKKHIVLYMIASIIGWGAVLSGIIYLFPNVFF